MTKIIAEIIIITNNIASFFILVRFLNNVLLQKECSKFHKRVGILGMLLLSIIGNSLINKLWINLILAIFIYSMIVILFYHAKLHIKIITSLFFVVFSFVAELMIALALTYFYGEVINNVRENVVFLLAGGSISKILLMALMEIIIRFKRGNPSNVSISSYALIISNPIVSTIFLIFNIYEPMLKNQYNNSIALGCISILYINIIVLYLFDSIVMQLNENSKFRLRESIMMIQQEQYKSILQGHDQVKKVRHDMIGHMISLEGYILKNDAKKALEYIHKLNKEIDLRKNGVISNNVVIDALINNVKTIIGSKNIIFSVDVIVPDEIKTEDIDLSIVLGNLLNNSVEACLRIKNEDIEKRIFLKIRYKNDCLLIELRNSYEIDTLKISGDNYLTSKEYRKKEEIGLGIGNVKEVVRKYNGVFQIKLEEDFFVVKVMI